MRSVTNGVHHNDTSNILERLARIHTNNTSSGMNTNKTTTISSVNSTNTNESDNETTVTTPANPNKPNKPTNPTNTAATLASYYKDIRLFHPDEMLKLSGFPSDFIFPDTISMNKQYNCIGNSISVSVVKCIMIHLFEKK